MRIASSAILLMGAVLVCGQQTVLAHEHGDGRHSSAVALGPRVANTATCCFVAGTLVETMNGPKPIESIEMGDRVWSRDVETGKTALRPVTDLIRRHDREIWIVLLTDDGVTTSQYETTDDHLWWIAETGWIRTDELSGQDVVATIDGNRVRVKSVARTGRTEATYNLTVADFETYFVGDLRVLVHNCPAGIPHEAGRGTDSGRPSSR